MHLERRQDKENFSFKSTLTPDSYDASINIHPTFRVVPVIMSLIESRVTFLIDTACTDIGLVIRYLNRKN